MDAWVSQANYSQSSENSSRQTHQPSTSRYTPYHVVRKYSFQNLASLRFTSGKSVLSRLKKKMQREANTYTVSLTYSQPPASERCMTPRSMSFSCMYFKAAL